MGLPKRFVTQIRSSRGFTMIELLVVIAIIGVLAATVLSAINPIEQINKGRDTRSRSDAAELINASERYFSIHEYYPWNVSANGYTADPNWLDDFSAEYFMSPTVDDISWVNTLTETDEVKDNFASRLIGDNTYTVYKPAGNNETMYACFVPSSRAFQDEAIQKCKDDLPPDLSTVAAAGSTDILCNNDRAQTATWDDQNPSYICLP